MRSIFTTGEILALDKPVTKPTPVPDETKLLILLRVIVSVVAVPVAPMIKPVMAACPEMVEIILSETEDIPPKPLILIPVIAAVPPVQLVKVLPAMVCVGFPAPVMLQPAIVVAPVTVIFEKLLPL